MAIIKSKLNTDSGADVGEYIEVLDAEDSPIITPTDDGGFIAGLEEPAEEVPSDNGFYANLALVIPDTFLQKMGTELLRKIEEDKEARKKRDEQQEDALRRSGLGKDAPGGAEFEGASRVVHPMLTEAAIDYASRVIKELWPAGGQGLVKPMIFGTPDKSKLERAARIVDHMNYQLNVQIKEAKAVCEMTLSQVPMGGSQWVRQVWDHRLRRPVWSFAPIDDIFLPASAADFSSAKRRTYRQVIDKVEFHNRIASGMYRDIDETSPSEMPESSKSEDANRRIEGKEDNSENIDGVRTVYETMEYMEVTDDISPYLGNEEKGTLYPYLFHLDEVSKKIIGLYRDWEEGDPSLEPIEHLFEFPLIPWRGAYAIGLPQIIGGLSAAATGALRALLDSAHVNNAVSGFIRKGAGVSGQSRRAQIGELTEIDCPIDAPDLRSQIMLAPFNQPSPVLFQLLGFIVEAATGIVRTSLDESAVDTNANVPVGTQLSRVEQGMMVFCACFGRAHDAFNRLLNGLYRLNRLYLPDEIKVDTEGRELFVRRKDYEGAPCIKPISDPTIYSDQQRFYQISAIQQRAAVTQNIYNSRKVEERFLQWMKIPDWEELLVDVSAPEEMNAVNENVALVLGRPVQVFPHQDHLAHFKTLIDFMQSPLLGFNALFAPSFIKGALQHAVHHICYFYANHATELMENAAGDQIKDLLVNDERVKQLLDRLLAKAGETAVHDTEKAITGAVPILQQALQIMQQLAPKPPMDPAAAAIQAATAETQRKAQADQATHQLTAAQQADKTQIARAQLALQAAGLRQKEQSAIINAQTEQVKTAQDNQTAREIAALRHTETGNFSTGESLG